jgi:flagellar basal-body rod protein FlgB
MPSLDSIFGIHERALYLREKRSETLAANLANADTPHYKARDFDFRAALENAQADFNERMPVEKTNISHFDIAMDAVEPLMQYRIPTQDSLDGNTVETDVEKAKFAENTVRYQATLEFLNSRIKGLKTAITGQ